YYVINAAGGMMLANVACDGVPGIAYVYCSQTGTACADTTIVSGLRVNNNSKRFKDDRSSGHFGDGTEGGIAPSLLNGWTNYSPAHQEAAFFKDPFGFVHLNGVIKGGKVGGGSPILVLPPSYRPAKYILFSVTAAGQHGEAQVAANGNVTLQSGGNAWLSLNGISFRAA